MDLSAKSIAGQIARMKTDALSPLLNPNSNDSFDIAQLANGYITSQQGIQQSSGIQALAGISAVGRNMALPDPESAYKMMTEINYRSVQYQAQHTTLADMQSGVTQLGQAAAKLDSIGPESSFSTVKSQLQSFADQYNSWRREFDTDSQDPELLGNTQAAQAARHALQSSISSPFHGAQYGLQGLSALGLEIDPVSKMAKLDVAAFESTWNKQPADATAAIQDFSKNFTEAANLLTANGNFFQKQLGNLDRAIDYIQSNQTALQKEFGLGDPPKLSQRLALAVAEYQKNQGMAN
nr:flagellar filament capping protein FliD [uncultured Deefgea sp.]